MTPVFMIGTQRSGSNLLRLMLNQLSELASPHPPHILERMCPLIDNYGDLSDDNNFRILVDDVCRLVELNPVEWSGVTFDRDDIIARCKSNSLAAVHGAVYDVYAESQNAKTWCCKSLANINYVDDIEAYFDAPKYIYLYRDGRDVALSFQKAVVGEKHIYNIADDWASTQRLAIDLREKIDSSRFFNISYEELTAEPEKCARAMCDFLNVEYTDSMLEFHKTSEAKNAASSSKLWGNVTSPVMSNNSKKYLKEMSQQDLAIIESVAGDVFDKLGYGRDSVKKGEELQFSQADIDNFNKMNKELKEKTQKTVDKDDLERRQRQAKLLEEIKARNAA